MDAENEKKAQRTADALARSKSKEVMLSLYERNVKKVLHRISPADYEAPPLRLSSDPDRKKAPDKRYTIERPFVLTDRNRQLLIKYYTSLTTARLSFIRQSVVLGITARLLEMLGKDYDKTSKSDIEELASKLNTQNIQEETRCDYLAKLKRFDKWFFYEEQLERRSVQEKIIEKEINDAKEKGSSEAVQYEEKLWKLREEDIERRHSFRTKWIRTSIGAKHRKLPEEMLYPKDIKAMLDATDNARDKALIHLMWDSGARTGEIVNLKLKDLQFDKNECKVRLRGKVGERPVLLCECVLDLKAYVNLRKGASPEEAVFIVNDGTTKGEPMTHPIISKVVKGVARKAGVNKRVYSYVFRHSSITYFGPKLTDVDRCRRYGWTLGSRQVREYMHMSDEQHDDNVRVNLYGKPKKVDPDELKPCEICGYFNGSAVEVCEHCNNPITISGVLHLKQQNSLLSEQLSIVQQVYAIVLKKVQAGVPEELARFQAINEVADGVAEQIKATKALVK